VRYFVPDIRLMEEGGPQVGFEEKLGGLPWGLQASHWPHCKDCGKAQSLLAQFVHAPPRLDLGREGRILSVFQCNHDPGMCSSWEGGSGANACLIFEPEDLIDGPTPLPASAPPIDREVRIVNWIAREDEVNESSASKYYSDQEYFALGKEGWQMPASGTRLGSVPCWIQSPDEAPKDGWRFVGQLDSTYSFYNAPAENVPGVWKDPSHWEGRSHGCEGPNLGDGGIAYLFLKENEGRPEGWFFWQCG
jgi:hypothetical protein